MMLNVSLLKKALKVSTLVAVFAVGSATMRADEVNFSGTALGSFSGTPSTTSTNNGLTYYGSSFNDTTSNGFLSFGGNGVANTSNFNNFGAFTLSNTTTAAWSNVPFELMINFSNPTGITSGQSSNFAATVFGNVNSTGNGGAQVVFNPSSAMYSFSNSTQTGSFTLNLNNVSINPGQTASVTGYITSTATGTAVTPEPMSLSLLGTGLMGIAFIAYRRMRNGEAASMPLAF